MKWLIGILLALAAFAGLAWYFVLDGAAPARADSQIDLAAYRALVADDPPGALPTEVRIEFVGESTAPSFAAEAGNFSGQRTFSYNSLQIVAPGGEIVVDGAVDRATLEAMSDGKGEFHQAAYDRVLDAMSRASAILITHEHLDHVMAIARNPQPSVIAPRLALTREQLDGLPQHAVDGQLAPEIAQSSAEDYTAPRRLAPGVVAHATPGHSPGSMVIYVRTAQREYLLIGDIAWVMDSVRDARGRPRLIRTIMSAVDPDRPAVLRQLRELHDLEATEPGLVIVPAHDDAYLRNELMADGALIEGFTATPAAAAN